MGIKEQETRLNLHEHDDDDDDDENLVDMTTTFHTVAMFLLLICENISYVIYSYIRDIYVSNLACYVL